jgi:hypothetical protein
MWMHLIRTMACTDISKDRGAVWENSFPQALSRAWHDIDTTRPMRNCRDAPCGKHDWQDNRPRVSPQEVTLNLSWKVDLSKAAGTWRSLALDALGYQILHRTAAGRTIGSPSLQEKAS